MRVRFVAIIAGLLLCGIAAEGRPAAVRVHPDVWLKNEHGERIEPVRNRADPYSPRATCGGCHGYGIITSGYHFQQGFDVMSDHYDAARPWQLSPGRFGKWEPLQAAGRLAAKVNADRRQVDLSTYDWIGGAGGSAACGGCHPGGGSLEYGRNGAGRADLSSNLAAAEGRSTRSPDGDFSSRATPDGRSHFRESGVVEADCLICHKPDYRIAARNEQLIARNYRWAATAGAGLGAVAGAVFTPGRGKAPPPDTWDFSRRPRVTYRFTDGAIFTGEGRLRGSLISGQVASRNCLQCHGTREAQDTGSAFEPSFDVHAGRGLICTDCHGLVGKTAGERLRHQIAKGRSTHNSVRDDLDGIAMKTCTGCHHEGRYGPDRTGMPASATNPVAAHAARYPKVTFHTELIACNGCHAKEQPAKGLALLDMSSGEGIGFTADDFAVAAKPADYGRQARVPWPPWLVQARDGDDHVERYMPVVPKRALWFGERMGNGEIRPIGLHFVRLAYRSLPGLAAKVVTGADGAAIKVPTVTSEEDIGRMIGKFTAMGFADVVYVADRLYELKGGRLVSREAPGVTSARTYAVSHGVGALAKKGAYGTAGYPGGCLDCHGETSAFFTKMRIVNVRGFLGKDYPRLMEPNAEPQMYDWGFRAVPPFE